MPDANDTIRVGSWVARFRGTRGRSPLSRAHLVETTVATRVVTRCGREMFVATFNGLHHGSQEVAVLRMVDNPSMIGRCEQCS